MKSDALSKAVHHLNYPIPLPSLSYSYVTRPELLSTRYMRNKQKEDAFLSQYMIDHVLYAETCPHIQKHMPGSVPPGDEITRCLREVEVQDVVSVASVFACQILLDLVGILGDDVSRGYRDLQDMAVKTGKVLHSTGTFSHDISLPVCWLARDQELPWRLSTLCNKWVKSNPLPFLKKEKTDSLPPGWEAQTNFDELEIVEDEDVHSIIYTKEQQNIAKSSDLRGVELPKVPKFTSLEATLVRVPEGMDMEEFRAKLMREEGIDENDPEVIQNRANAERLGAKYLQPNPDMEFFFTHNPVYCGTVALKVLVDFEEAGLTLAKYHVVPTLLAYLYSEVRRTKLLNLEWPEVEQFIEMHTTEIFGGQRPKSSAEAFIKFSKILCMSTSGRDKVHERKLPYKEPHCNPLPISQALRPFLKRKEIFSESTLRLEALVQTRRETVYHTSKHKRRETRRRITPFQFLDEMQHLLSAEVPKLHLDYITLTKTCTTLMKQIHAEIKTSTGMEYPLYHGEETTEPLYPSIVLEILRASKDYYSERNVGAPSHHPELEAVARVLRKYLDIRARVAAMSK